MTWKTPAIFTLIGQASFFGNRFWLAAKENHMDTAGLFFAAAIGLIIFSIWLHGRWFVARR